MKHECIFINGIADKKIIEVEDYMQEYRIPIPETLVVDFTAWGDEVPPITKVQIAHYKRIPNSWVFILDYVG